MQTVSVHEAKTHLSRLLKKIAEGKEIIITSYGKPVATLAPIAKKNKRRRVGDMFKGQIVIPDDFDDPMPDEWFETDEYPQK